MRVVSVFIFSIFLVTKVFAGESMKPKFSTFSGYFLTAKGDTLRGTLGCLEKRYFWEEIQTKLYYMPATGDPIPVLPDTCRGFGWVSTDGTVVEFVPEKFSRGWSFQFTQPCFLRRFTRGSVELYGHYKWGMVSADWIAPGDRVGTDRSFSHKMGYDVTYMFKKGTGPLHVIKYWGAEKDLKEYFSECPSIQEKIGGDLKINNPGAMADFYNQNCGLPK